ncbi:ScyD/ScyE family protein [Geodermatophilus sp. CPCC 206100]|uniref:ScyD/ScyE family protein n=1 Tax=Geodermatophilus sp. CPCC 206100 TaxID=3020054 RepID=UPI003AFF9A4C
MRRTIVAAGSFALLLGSATAASATVETPDSSEQPDHVVVATGLDNPRQLAWAGRTLLVAEGGQGGDDCTAPPPVEAPATDAGTAAPGTGSTDPGSTGAGPVVAEPPADDDGTLDQGPGDVPVPAPDTTATPTEPTTGGDTATDTGSTGTDSAATAAVGDLGADGICDGFTGAISAIDRPGRTVDGDADEIVSGLYSVESAEGTVGADGVATGFPGALVIAQGEGTPEALAAEGDETDDPDDETQEHLLLSVDDEVLPWVDLGEAEERLNPDRKTALDSNPNAVIVVDPTPRGERGVDEYALVADAGANAVWRVTPDFSDLDESGLPDYEVSVFAAYESDDDETTPEFVPSALARDRAGNVYVGGVGSLRPGVAEVVRYDADGDETGRWDGFTGINGLAVAPDGEHVYVSQILGSDPTRPSGNVVRFTTDDPEEATYTSVDVPFPSGLALGRGDSVYVSAYSTSPADADDPATEEVEPGGQVWRVTFAEDAEELALPVTVPADPEPATPAPAETPTDPTATPTDPITPTDPTVTPTDPAGTPTDPGGTAAGSGAAATDDDGTADQGPGDVTP